MAPRQVSQATKALVNMEEMDAALARAARAQPPPAPLALRAPAAIRLHRVDTASAAFLCASTLLYSCLAPLVSLVHVITVSCSDFKRLVQRFQGLWQTCISK